MKPDDVGAPLHIVTGKGGTGKTTVAAALALALAAGGKRTLVIEVEGRNGLAEVFDSGRVRSWPKHVASAADGGEVYAMSIDPETVLLEQLSKLTRVPGSEAVLRRVGAIDFATSIAPGVRDVLLLGRACQETLADGGDGDSDHDHGPYDAVIVDAPPTGRVIRFLNSGRDFAALARVGSVSDQAKRVDRIVRSDSTSIHLVTILEEMPVQETLDCVVELDEVGLPIGTLIVNFAVPPVLTSDTLAATRARELNRSAIERQLALASLPVRVNVAGLTDRLVVGAGIYATRGALAAAQAELLDSCGRPRIDVARQPDGVSRSGLTELARELRQQLASFEPANAAGVTP